MKLSTTALTLALAAYANAHGYFVDPPARQPGTQFTADCGSAATSTWEGDIYGNIQGLVQIAASQDDFNVKRCKVDKCKGMKFVDNKANVQSYSTGQKVDLNFEIRAPHSGTANVSVIALRSNKVLKTLKSWDEYAMTSRPTRESEQKFSVKMPDLSAECAKAGQCAIQMYWDSREADQTYESCIDFAMGGASGSKRHARDFAVVDEPLL